jgi:RES domain-containing protein
MQVYRIINKAWIDMPPSGNPARWNLRGDKVRYCSENIATSFLETMINRAGSGYNDDFVIQTYLVPQSIKVKQIKRDHLPSNWETDPGHTMALGHKWYISQDSLLLKVPTVIVPESFNFIINYNHPDINKIKLLSQTKLIPDERIETILKNSR